MPVKTARPADPATFSGTSMLQSAIYADLQATNLDHTLLRPVPQRPVLTLAKGSFANLLQRLRELSAGRQEAPLSSHLRRDIGLQD